MTQEKIQVYTRRITMANKTQMITILYEMVLDYLAEAKDALELDDKKGFSEGLSKAMNCIDELIHSLNLNYELGKNLLALYLFEKRQILIATAKNSDEELDHVNKTFEALHSAYVQLEKMNNDEALMTNVPKVYAGLTYGKGNLKESFADNVMSRGYMA
ncbi:flagellar export chaperone FliS [Butyrivibrio sp. XPD2002]|jgi:flagellar protein FliS|uniref:flagellar export chaperone FliS n=1 Tax=Butyrivibrio sp. XPD2002 TaxID=1280665 RepID=UPI000419EE6F|nr:flagellar protein FliS [Butyrivibrio sp. XPD2002]